MTREHTVSELGQTEVGVSEPAPALDTRGDAIGRFIVLEKLGVGGMGVVYAAYDPNLDRKVAVKLLSTAVASSEVARIRMLREAQAMARIDHPNVLRVYEAGQLDDQIYIAMEFAAGGTLRSWLTKQPRTEAEIVEVFAQAGRGLAAAHAAGLVHRDFKPDNVMLLGDGRVRVSDFGIVGTIGEAPAAAAQLDAPLSDTTPLSQDLTRTGAVMGTPSYMAPEQFRGQHVGPAADQFAFCVALYAALCKQKPFEGATYAELAGNVIAGAIRPFPREAHVSSRISSAITRGLSIAPEQRFASMAALLAALDRRPRRRRAWLGIGGAAAIAAGVAAFVVVRPTTEACTGAQSRLAPTWNPARAAMLAETFTIAPRPDATAVVERVVPIFDRWSTAWEQAYVGACEDTRVRAIQSEHMLDLRMDCLARRLDEARATSDALLGGGGDVVDHAFDLVGALPDISICANASGLTAAVAPPTAIASASVAALRDKLSRARAQRKLAHYAQARELASSAVADARAVGYQPAIAEALLELGTVQGRLADRAALATLGDAMTIAIAAGASDVAIVAAAREIGEIDKLPAKFPVGDELGEVATALADHTAPPPTTIVDLDDAIGGLLADEGSLDASQARYEQALALATKQLGGDDDHTVTTIGRLAQLQVKRHHWSDARADLQRVADAKQRLYGSDHPEYATALDSLASIDAKLGQSGKSKELRERALAIRIAALGPDHPDVASSYINLGGVYAEAGDRVTAKAYFEHAFAIVSKVYGDDSVQTIEALTDLGNVLAHQGDLAAARGFVKHALANAEKAYPPDDPRLADTIDNLGMVERDDHHYDDALALFERAERITEKAFGTKDPRAAEFLGEIAATYRVMNKLPEARTAMDRTVAAIAASYGPDSPSMATALGNVALLDLKLDDYAGALDNFNKAREIFEVKLGKDHPAVAMCLTGAGQALDRLKRDTEAVVVLERALAIANAKQFPPAQVAEMHFYLGDALYVKPATRARGRDEIKIALAIYDKAHDTVDSARMKSWLRKH